MGNAESNEEYAPMEDEQNQSSWFGGERYASYVGSIDMNGSGGTIVLHEMTTLCFYPPFVALQWQRQEFEAWIPSHVEAAQCS